MANRLMPFVFIVLHAVNNYKVKQLNKKQLVQVVYARIFQQLLLMPKAVCYSLILRDRIKGEKSDLVVSIWYV